MQTTVFSTALHESLRSPSSGYSHYFDFPSLIALRQDPTINQQPPNTNSTIGHHYSSSSGYNQTPIEESEIAKNRALTWLYRILAVIEALIAGGILMLFINFSNSVSSDLGSIKSKQEEQSKRIEQVYEEDSKRIEQAHDEFRRENDRLWQQIKPCPVSNY